MVDIQYAAAEIRRGKKKKKKKKETTGQKSVPDITYNVFSGMLNPTQPTTGQK